jgi:hypothetical protein
MFKWLSDAKEYLTTPGEPFVWGDSETVGSTNYNLSHRDDVEEEPKSRYRSCVPDTSEVVDSAVVGCLGGALGSAAGGPIAAGAGCLAGGATGAAVQMYADSKKIQSCMDEEDKKEAEEKLASESKPEPIVTQYKKGTYQYAIAYNSMNEQRHAQGLGGLTTWEYDAVLNKGIDPLAANATSTIENSVLCPSGGLNNTSGSGGGGGPGYSGGSGNDSRSSPSGVITEICHRGNESQEWSCISYP